MTNKDKSLISELRTKGLGYKAIAKQLNLPVSSISSYLQRKKENESLNSCKCKNCGLKLKQTPGHRQKVFCSDKCRMNWWTNHPEMKTSKIVTECKCAMCNKTFIVNRRKVKKFCSWNCYTKFRSGGEC